MSAGSRSKAEADNRIGQTLPEGQMWPGAHLRAELARLGLDQVAVSKATGVSRQSVNNIINGRQAISRAMAGKLGRLTGHASDYWLSARFGGDSAPSAAGFGPLVDHQIERAVKDGMIGIAPFSAAHIAAASILLTLAKTVTAGSDRIDIARKGFTLVPGKSVAASTIERLELPHDYLGRLGVATTLRASGLIVSGSVHVEPGFKGRLQFFLLNAGSAPFVLRAHDPVVALEIVRLGRAAGA